jgi:N-acetylglutamate synthase-like GNAT family acetyltransferase
LLVVRNADREVVACAGVEPQPFQKNMVLVRLLCCNCTWTALQAPDAGISLFSGAQRGTLRAYPPADAVRRPVVSNLAVAAKARRKGLAAKLMRACEDLCQDWGFDECLLLVENTNKRARGLYSKLGYKVLAGGDEIDAPTLKVVDGAIIDARVRNVCMRKSLKPFPVGALENAQVKDAVGIVAAGAAANWLAENSDSMSDPAALLEALRDTASALGVYFTALGG